MSALSTFKYLLTAVGQRISGNGLRNLQASLNYVWTGHWMAQHGLAIPRRVRNRQKVWLAGIERLNAKRVLYLEFGVAQGESIRFWSTHLGSSDAIFHGFDSFVGLPEKSGPWSLGQFNTNGIAPAVADPRVHFYRGWFNESLPLYQLPPHDMLVLNMDADLYSSTIYVLRHLRPYIRKGTLIYFDEFNHPEHEQRAFEEFIGETNLQFQIIAADETLAFVMLECQGLVDAR